MIRKEVIKLLSMMTLGVGCASPSPALFAMHVPPVKAYTGAPRARDRIAVILIESAAPRGHGELELIEIRVESIDGENVGDRSGYAVLPGVHELQLSGRLRVGTASYQEFAAPLELEAQADGLYGISAEESACPSRRCIVAQDLNAKRSIATVDMRFAQPPHCGLGYELVLLLPLLIWRRRASRTRLPYERASRRCAGKNRDPIPPESSIQ